MAEHPLARRLLRRQELVDATRALWDERGAQVAGVEEIAQAVGIARGLIYRQFASKDELFVLTVTSYLTELDAELGTALRHTRSPERRLERALETYADYCLRHPAFVDATLGLMRRPARDLRAELSDAVWIELGRGMACCLGRFALVLAEDAFDVPDPATTANVLWAQMLGALQLARIGVGVRRLEDGAPDVFRIEPADVVATCVRNAMVAVHR